MIYLTKNEITQKAYQACSQLYREYGGVLALLLVLQLVTYSYFFTSLIFTNHTFPNSWVFPYPSYMTQGEGRWLSDLIIRLQGGSGVQPFQMYVAITVQSFNGILFARFLGLKKRFEVLLAAAFLCLYPAFLDNYSFGKDHITFVIGDTLALVGILYCKNTVQSVKNAVVSSIFFVLALASYQPKIALIGLLCICYLKMHITDNDKSRPFSLKETLLGIVYMSCVFFGACLLYFVSIKLTTTYNIGSRTYINSIPEMLGMTFGSYGTFLRYYTFDSDYLPKLVRFLPALGISLGCLALLQKAKRKNLAAVAIIVVLLLLIPIVLRATYIINNNSWEYAGRITFANGYALLFFLSSALQAEWLNQFVRGILTVFIYFFIVVGTQESNAATFKTIYDLNMINRIVSRIETVAEEVYQKKYALVVIGHYQDFERSRYVRVPNSKHSPHVSSFAFAAYRQSEILNYFFGKNVFHRPTTAQKDKAIASAQGRRPWPAKESVYVLDDEVIVLVLEKYRPGTPLTWTKDR